YVDYASGELRHGPPDSSPINANLLLNGAHGQLVCDATGSRQPIVCLLDRCQTVESANRRGGGPFTSTMLDVVPLEAGTVGLKAGGVCLCAEADGRVTLSRPVCSEWEKFSLDATVAEHIGLKAPGAAASSGKRKFLQLAPFLSAADSPKERRTLSRAFD